MVLGRPHGPFTHRTVEASMPGEAQPQSNDPARRAAERTALTRMLIVIAVWLATWILRQNGTTTRLGLDVILAGASWWAVLPGRRQAGSGFGEHGHWTSLLIALPVGFGIATAAELWHLLRGGA
jgi:hypothetical protein